MPPSVRVVFGWCTWGSLPSSQASGALLLGLTNKKSKNYADSFELGPGEGYRDMYSLSVVPTFLVGFGI